MTNLPVHLRVWKENHVVARVLQGEGGSRTLTVTFLDADGRPVDLTGCTPRMYLTDSNPPIFTDGTIADADGGTAKFAVTSGMTEKQGVYSCQFLLAGPDFPPLKADGLALYVMASNLESAAKATKEYSALIGALNKADTAADHADAAADRADAAAQKAEDAVSGRLVSSIDERITAQKNRINGIVGLDKNGKVASAQLPAMDYVPNSKAGAADGIATLDTDGKLVQDAKTLDGYGTPTADRTASC